MNKSDENVKEALKAAQEVFDMCSEQEERYVFDSFSKEDALKLGLYINEKSKKYSRGVAINITVNGVTIFSYCQEGANRSNIEWGLRKQRVVELEEMSSLKHRAWMELTGNTWETRKLDPNLYSEHGGGFPIRIKNTGVVGAVTVSGLPHLEDHQLIIDALEAFFKEKNA